MAEPGFKVITVKEGVLLKLQKYNQLRFSGRASVPGVIEHLVEQGLKDEDARMRALAFEETKRLRVERDERAAAASTKPHGRGRRETDERS